MVNIKQLLQEKRITQNELAKMLGVHKSTISCIANKKMLPSLDTALKLSKILEVPVEELFDFDSTKV